MTYDPHAERRHEQRDRKLSNGTGEIWIDVRRPTISIVCSGQPEFVRAVQEQFSAHGACTVTEKVSPITKATETWIDINEKTLRHIPDGTVRSQAVDESDRFTGIYAATSQHIVSTVERIAAQYGFRPVETSAVQAR